MFLPQCFFIGVLIHLEICECLTTADSSLFKTSVYYVYDSSCNYMQQKHSLHLISYSPQEEGRLVDHLYSNGA